MSQNLLIDIRDVKFILYELLKVQDFSTEFSKYSDFDKEIYDETLDLAFRLASEQFYPASMPGDREACTYDPDTGKVSLPSSYLDPLKAYYETGFIGIADDPDIGGLGMPGSIAVATEEIFMSGCMPMMLYPGLSHGTMNLINLYGNDKQKAQYIEKIMSGEWGGTMCLTEPEAGSDVGALTTTAYPQDDGTYKIKGQKIFISCGGGDFYDNIVHAVLARIEGDPPGTKGISIFIVPDYLPNEDGSKGAANDVRCTGIEHKLGIRGSSTCTLAFGENDSCTGYLLGEVQKGMKIMFLMMNESRLGVALQGLAVASTAYMHSLNYARERIQGVHVTQMMNPEAEHVPIIEHPDVKRMLMRQKSLIEGMRILTYFLGHEIDIAESSEGETAQKAQAIVDILIPICKAGNTDTSVLLTSDAIQVYGGYGYCMDYPVEQYYRDAKITAIYEGTNGIQAMDLTMRKILMNKEQYNYHAFIARVKETIAQAEGVVNDKYVEPVRHSVEICDSLIAYFVDVMNKGKFLNLFLGATPLCTIMHMLSLAWVHLWSLTIAYPKMKELTGDCTGEERAKLIEENREVAYYSGRVLSAQYYIGSEFQTFFSMADSLLKGETAVLKMSSETFSS